MYTRIRTLGYLGSPGLAQSQHLSSYVENREFKKDNFSSEANDLGGILT